MKPSAQVVVGIMIAVLLSGTAFGQANSDEPVKSVRISGRVTDATGAPVRDVTVALKLAGSSNTTAPTKTGEMGEYTFLVVPHRSYELHFAAPGFRQETKLVTADKDTDVGTLLLFVAQGGGVMMEPLLWAAITVPQPIFYQDRIEDLSMSFALVNDGGSTVDPKIGSSHLLINGVEPKDWFIVIGNGPRNEWFNALPPGQVLQFGYQLGPRYFQKPVVYTVRWEGENFKSPELTFRVVPRNR